MADSFKEDSYDEGSTILESGGGGAALKVLGTNKCPGVDGISIEVFQATKEPDRNVLFEFFSK